MLQYQLVWCNTNTGKVCGAVQARCVVQYRQSVWCSTGKVCGAVQAKCVVQTVCDAVSAGTEYGGVP